MPFNTSHPECPNEDARPELLALLARGIEPLKIWIRTELAHAHPMLGFHVVGQWDNTLLACYLSHFLPRLSPTSADQQDVVVIHLPDEEENGAYNRIFTQCSGYCLIPDAFHTFLLELAHAFGTRFLPV